MKSTDTLVEAAGRWFLQSGIQEASGGVARYYRCDLRQNARVSTEITGYAVSTLLALYRWTGGVAYLEAALQAARFLTRTAWDAQLCTFPFELTSESSFAYFFDCGIIVRGLLSAWRVTEDSEFRDIAIAAGRAMLTDFPPRAAIHPILVLPEKRPLAWTTRWSARPGCYQLKSAMAWHELFEVTGESAFLRGYESAVEAALENDPKFLTDELDPMHIMDRLHAYEYFLEGLVPALGRQHCAASFREGVDRTARYLAEIAPVFVRSDVYAQLLRLRLLGEKLGALPLNQSAAAHEAEQAASFQIESSDTGVDGGFLFGRKQGEELPFVNPVSTAFCVQALAWWDDRQAGRLQAERQELV
ncbi:MAG: hypothetical protein JOZ32_21955 [Bryobacterales bacterium]|nr:hypothetical protein [Bryobacterales bacterium]